MNFEIKEKLGVINKNTWQVKELNIISWYKGEDKYDIRSWDTAHKNAGKGIALTKEELLNLKELLNKLDLT